METHNIISTPLITGNVGSCTSESINVVKERLSVWKEKTETIVTNSCTGQVTTYESWEWTPSLFFVTFAVTILAIIISGIFFAVIGEIIKVWLNDSKTQKE